MITLDEAVAIANAQEIWNHEDDLCDCTFQRIGYWYNPYIGEKLEVRWCCIWAKLFQQFPEYVRVTKNEPAEWNGEADMPKAIWVRQLANVLGIDVSAARGIGAEPPKGRTKQIVPFVLLNGGDEIPIDLMTWKLLR